MIGLENLVLLIKLPSASVMFVVVVKKSLLPSSLPRSYHQTVWLHILGLSIYTGQGMAGPSLRSDGTEFHLGDDRIYANDDRGLKTI